MNELELFFREALKRQALVDIGMVSGRMFEGVTVSDLQIGAVEVQHETRSVVVVLEYVEWVAAQAARKPRAARKATGRKAT
jgi:hypothetical protein